MKISELTSKEFLGNSGAVANSYVLINYEDSTTEGPVTYKATVQELGKAIAENLKLYKDDNNGGAQTISAGNNAYTNNTAKSFVTSAEKTKINNAVTTSEFSDLFASCVHAGHPRGGQLANANYVMYITGSGSEDGTLNYYSNGSLHEITDLGYGTNNIGNYNAMEYDSDNNILGFINENSDLVPIPGLVFAGDASGGSKALSYWDPKKDDYVDLDFEPIVAAAAEDVYWIYNINGDFVLCPSLGSSSESVSLADVILGKDLENILLHAITDSSGNHYNFTFVKKDTPQLFTMGGCGPQSIFPTDTTMLLCEPGGSGSVKVSYYNADDDDYVTLADQFSFNEFNLSTFVTQLEPEQQGEDGPWVHAVAMDASGRLYEAGSNGFERSVETPVFMVDSCGAFTFRCGGQNIFRITAAGQFEKLANPTIAG